jgi:hypothetical protein
MLYDRQYTEENMLKRRVEFTRMWPFLWGLLLFLLVAQTVCAGNPEIIYDKATDKLSVQADMVSLDGLLARIALLSGVEFLMDREVERQVSITLEELSLENGLKKIMQALNLRYAMIYQKKEGQEPLLISMKIVPEGKENNPNLNLVPVVDVNGEAVIRSISGRPLRAGQTPPTIFDYAQERWQARLNKMPEEKRRRIVEHMNQRQEKRAARMEEMENRRAEREKRVAERRARRLAAEEKLRVSNPELHELRKQQRQEVRQQVMEELAQE